MNLKYQVAFEAENDITDIDLDYLYDHGDKDVEVYDSYETE